VNNFASTITKEQVSTLLRKIGSDQIIILDVDDSDSFSIYVFNLIAGMQYQRVDIPDEENRNNSITCGVGNILTDELLEQVNQLISCDRSLSTAWVFTGELTTLINQDLGRFFLKFFSNLKVTLPFINRLHLDSYNLLNYLKIFPDKFLSMNFTKIIKEVPLNIVNLESFEGRVDEINLVGLDGDLGSGDEKILVKKNDVNLIRLEEDTSIQGIPSVSMAPGFAWFWRKEDKLNLEKVDRHKKISLISDFQIKPIKNIKTLNFRKFSKESFWQLDPVVEKLTKKKRVLEISPKVFLRIKGVKKEDLLVVHEQRVHEGQLLNKSRNVKLLFETKECKSPVDGYVSTKYIDQGFLVVKLLDKKKKDFTWLDSKKLVKKGSQLSEKIYKLESFSLPVAYSFGSSYTGTLVLADSFEDAEKYAQDMINVVVAVNFPISKDQLVYLYKMDVRAIISAGMLPDIVQIDEAYWQLFNYTLMSNLEIDQDYYAFDDYVLDVLKENEGIEVFVDSKQKELKFLVQNAKGEKFGMQHQPDNQPEKNQQDLKKGQQVIVHSQEYLYKKAEIMVQQGSELVLKDVQTSKLFKVQAQNVSLIK
jgi:hypothetical protein